MRRILHDIVYISVIVSVLGLAAPIHAACNIIEGRAYGDCSGVRINRGAKTHLTVRSYTSETAIIAGATVLRGGVLDLSGTSNGDITVHEGGRLRLSGIVNGTVRNLGGNVEIQGILERLHTIGGHAVIAGTVGSVSGIGKFTLEKGSVIGGIPVEETVHKKGKF